MLLLSGLPFDKSLFLAPYYEAYLDTQSEDATTSSPASFRNTKQEYDRKANRSGKVRSRISLDDFIAQSDGLGNKTTLQKQSKSD